MPGGRTVPPSLRSGDPDRLQKCGYMQPCAFIEGSDATGMLLELIANLGLQGLDHRCVYPCVLQMTGRSIRK